MPKSATNPAWINASVLVGAGFFIFALIVSAVFDPTIRLLHMLQALIYVAVIVAPSPRSRTRPEESGEAGEYEQEMAAGSDHRN